MSSFRLLVASLVIASVTTVQGQNLWSSPECVAFDEVNNRYLVSSAGNGTIVAIAPDGTQSVFNTDVTQPLGNELVGNTLYVSDNGNRIVGLDLTSGATVMDLPTPRTDGITWDGGNFLYAVATAGQILKVDIAAESYTVLVSTGLAAGPQDVLYDGARNRLVVVHWNANNNPTVLAISLADLSITSALANFPSYVDGISMNTEGMIFLSSHQSGGIIFRWNGEYDDNPLPIAYNLDEPAGSCYNERDDILAVACYAGDSVAFVFFADPDQDGIPWLWDNCPESHNPDQSDADGDGDGDSCDTCTDTDGDSFGNPGYPAQSCQLDNCAAQANLDQADLDLDNVGDLCDNCPSDYNPVQEDSDLNGVGDVCEGCCINRVGDANGSLDDEPTIGDVTILIDAKFITSTCDGIIPCLAEADINQSGGVAPVCDDITLGDITVLIDYLFITGPNLGLPDCL